MDPLVQSVVDPLVQSVVDPLVQSIVDPSSINSIPYSSSGSSEFSKPYSNTVFKQNSDPAVFKSRITYSSNPSVHNSLIHSNDLSILMDSNADSYSGGLNLILDKPTVLQVNLLDIHNAKAVLRFNFLILLAEECKSYLIYLI